jgi:hypothetical protein
LWHEWQIIWGLLVNLTWFHVLLAVWMSEGHHTQKQALHTLDTVKQSSRCMILQIFRQEIQTVLCVMEPTWCTIYLQFYWVTTPLHVSGLLVAHHQEVAMYIYGNWHVLYILVDRQWAWMACQKSTRCTTRTNCHICTLLPPEDGLLASLKHVEV